MRHNNNYTGLSIFFILILILLAFSYDSKTNSIIFPWNKEKFLQKNEIVDNNKQTTHKNEQTTKKKENENKNLSKNFFVKKKYVLKVNEKKKLELNTNAKFNFISEDDTIATVSSDGIVTGKTSGNIKIIAIDENGLRDEISIEVKETAKKSFNIIKDKVIISKSYNYLIDKKVVPASELINWSSSNESIAAVNKDGLITPKNIGTAVITGVTKSGLKDSIIIEVIGGAKKKENKYISLNKSNLALNQGDTYTLIADSNTNEKITWKSDNQNVAVVDSNGKVTAKKSGIATITALSGNLISKCIVKVIVPTRHVSSVSVNDDNVVLKIGSSVTILSTVTPSNADNKDVTWSSKDSKIAVVDNNGKITAVSVGKTEVVVTTVDGKKTATVNITVEPIKPSKLTLTMASTKITLGTTAQLTATVSPTNATDKRVTYSSSDTSIASVSSTGVISAKKIGTATISAKTVLGNISSSVNITVEPIVPTKLTLSSSATKINVGSTAQLTATVSPTNATDKSVKYTSSDTSVATVSSTGKITAKDVGTAKITAKTVSGGISATVSITVVENKTFTATFYTNGSSGSKVTKTCSTTSSSCSITTPSIMRSGFSILGWSTNKNATSASIKVNSSLSISSNVSYYAITSKTVTATFNKNTITSDISIAATSKSCTIRNAATVCSITTPSIIRSGFSIIGWSTNKTATTGTIAGNNISISSNATYYAITKLVTDGNIVGATGYPALNSKEYLYKTASTSGTKLLTLKWGTAFTILSESGSYWYVSYNGTKGYVLSKYCMINLPDYIPSMSYDITDSYSSILKSSGYSVPNVTGKALYKFKKQFNSRLRRDEFIAPLLYPTAKMLLKAQATALSKGYSLKLYDSYRPRSVSTLLSTNLTTLYNSNSTVKKNIDYSTGASGTKYSWGQGWFLANGLSTHNVGTAVDISMTKKGSSTDLSMPSAMEECSTKAIKYYSPNVSHVAANYSTGMLNSSAAQNMHTYLSGAGFGDLASEWWHFQDNDSYQMMKKLQSNGCDFTPSGIASQ